MRIRFFANGSYEFSKFSEFQDLTMEQAGEAVDMKLPQIELYLDSPGRNLKWEPELGLVFEFGVYKGFGLGGTSWSKKIEGVFADYKHLSVSGAEVVALLRGS